MTITSKKNNKPDDEWNSMSSSFKYVGAAAVIFALALFIVAIAFSVYLLK